MCLYRPECTKIAHRRSLAIFTADEGIAGNSAARIMFTRFHRGKNRGSLAIFFAEEIAHLEASKTRAIFPGAVKIAAATAENRAILVHSATSVLLHDPLDVHPGGLATSLAGRTETRTWPTSRALGSCQDAS